MSNLATYPSLNGMPVVISGGASGIGETLVREFAGQGSKVGFVDIAREQGEALAKELNDKGHTVRFTHCDITDTKAWQKTIAKFEAAHGAARALLNNAANDTRITWDKVTEEKWDAAIAVNLKQSFFAIQAVVPGMIAAGGGSIINFGSISWMILSGNMAGYTASKAGTHGMTRSLARDLGPHNIRVNTLVPGWIMTERQFKYWIDDAANALIDSSQALKGRVYPIDIARMALFLASDDSKMISAQNLTVDGGWANA